MPESQPRKLGKLDLAMRVRDSKLLPLTRLNYLYHSTF